MENNNTYTNLVNVNQLDHSYFLPVPEVDIQLQYSYSKDKDLVDNNNEKQSKKDKEESQEEISVHEENAYTRTIEGDASVRNSQSLEGAVTNIALSGVQLKSQIYMDNLSYKHHKTNSQDKIYLLSENRKNKTAFCSGSAIISVDSSENWLNINKHHNHLAPLVDIPMAYLRRNIGIAGTSSERTTDSIIEVYNTKVAVNSDGVKNYSLQRSRLRLSRMHRYCSVNPDTIEELGEMLKFDENFLKRHKKKLSTPSPNLIVQRIRTKQKAIRSESSCHRHPCSVNPDIIKELGEMLKFDEKILNRNKYTSHTQSAKSEVKRISTQSETISSKTSHRSLCSVSSDILEELREMLKFDVNILN